MRISDIFMLLVWIGGAVYAFAQPGVDLLHAGFWPLSAGAYLTHALLPWVEVPLH